MPTESLHGSARRPRRARRLAAAVAALSAAALVGASAAAVPQGAQGGNGHPGAAGIGDPYFPLDGNGGYDVASYDLRLLYRPGPDVLRGVAKIRARATQHLSRLNLDLVGLRVHGLRVDGEPARWSRTRHELQVDPPGSLRRGERFSVRVAYSGVPQPFDEPGLGLSGFFATDDGFVVAGQPHGAAGWFPVNDHPSDRAAYTFRVTVPRNLETVANGHLVDRDRHGRWTTWTYRAPNPMASYLATVDVGQFDLDTYREDGIRYLDAVDPDLDAPVSPTTGERFAISQAADSAYKRLSRTVTVPAAGGTLSFVANRQVEQGWDFFLVEAHEVGDGAWTTLPDESGHTSQDTGNDCAGLAAQHPFLAEHYLTVDPDAGTCDTTGPTGEWNAATGVAFGPEEWTVDLSQFAGQTIELSLAHVTDGSISLGGVTVDDVETSWGEGSTSFESGRGGWTVPGPPDGSPGNENDWVVGTQADAPASLGEIVDGSLARQPEIIDFLAGFFGRYPWRDAGAIVDDVQGLGFALETQTRPIYAFDFFTDAVSGDAVVVHELAHQWYGDSLTLRRWRDIWLNEGFATYAEWLWSEAEGLGTAQETFDFFYNDFIAVDDPWWQITIGDPGPDQLFEFPVYFRGAMTLHQLRQTVGDQDFFRILRTWARSQRGELVRTPTFIRLAERISGQQLDDLFEAWLYTPSRPGLPASSAAERRSDHVIPPAARATLRIARAEADAHH